MLAIFHLPSGICHYTKKAIVHLITMTLDIVILCTAHPLCTSSSRSFVVHREIQLSLGKIQMNALS